MVIISSSLFQRHLLKLTGLILLAFCSIFTSCKVQHQGEVYDIVVIGGGLMGSAAAWHLSKQGREVLVLEKQDSIYSQGSSMGDARIARSNNRGNDIWSYLHNRSIKESLGLIDFLKSTDDSRAYSIEDLYTTSPVTYVGRIEIFDQLLASLERQNVEYDLAVRPLEAMEMYDMVIPDGILVQREYNRLSGTLNPQLLIRYLHRGVKKLENKIHYNSEVSNIEFDEDSNMYRITYVNTSSGNEIEIAAKTLVSAAGPYTGELLNQVAPYYDQLISPERIFLAFYKIRKEVYSNLSKAETDKLHNFYPVINSSQGGRKGSFFSMIEYFDEDNIPIIKIGGHFQRSAIQNLNSVWSQRISEEEEVWSRNSTARYMRMLQLPVVAADLELVKDYSCVYSLTSSEVPLVSKAINEDGTVNDQLVVRGGMSGVGAKGAMTYGLIAADLITQRKEKDSLYHVTASQLGHERLFNDLKALE